MRAARWTGFVVAMTLCVAGCGDDDSVEPVVSTWSASWSHPLPQGGFIRGIGGSDEFNQWAVGDGGLIVEFGGIELHNVASPTTKTLHDVVAFNFGGNVLMVGDDGVILRNFVVEPSPTTDDLYSLFAFSESNVIAVGANGTIIEDDGGGWQSVVSPTSSDLYGVWGLENGETIAVGAGGVVISSTGGPWSVLPAFTTRDLNAVWADKPRDWFAVGDGGEIWQDRGAGWTPMASPRSDDFYDVFGSDSAYVWIVGDADSILFYDQVSWQPIAPNPSGRLDAIWATVCPLTSSQRRGASSARDALHCSNTYFAGAGGVVTRYTLFTTYDEYTDAVTFADLRGIHGRMSGDVYTVGDDGLVLRHDGSAWALSATGVSEDLHDVFMLSPLDVFIVGDGGRVLRGADGAWSPTTTGGTENLRGVWAQDATDVLVAGDAGALLQFDGIGWNPQSVPVTDYTDVGGFGSTAFAVARGGVIVRRDAGIWSGITSPVSTDLLGVWAASSANAFVVGAGGVILRIDGSDAQPMVSGVSADIVAVGGSGGVIWAVTGDGDALRYDGTMWNHEQSPPVAGYGGVFVRSTGGVLATGRTGSIIDFRLVNQSP